MEPPPNTTIMHMEESCAAPLQRARAPPSPGRAKALSPTARLSSMAVQSLEGVHLPFTKGTPPSAGGGSHSHLPSSSSFKNLTVVVQQQDPLAEEMAPTSHLFRRLEALEEENQRLRRLVEQLTVQHQEQEQQQQQQQQQQSPPKPRLLHAPASSPPRLAKSKASSMLGSSSSQQPRTATPTEKATSIKGGGGSSKRYPLGISRFSWPPGSPSSTVGCSLADLELAAQQEERSAASTPRPSSSLSRTPMGKGAATFSSSTLTACTPSTAKAGGSGSGGSSNSNNATAHRSPSTGAAAGQQQQQQQQPPLHFTEFAMCGVKRAVLRGEEPPQRSVQPVEALEVVMMEGAGCGGSGGCSSTTSSSDEKRGAGGYGPHVVPTPPSSSAALEKITEFCFPQGGRLELAPASQLELSTGKHRDSTHILLFTDEFGATSYGLCVTIWEPHPECPPSVVAALRRLQREDAAARAIQLFWREVLLARPAPLARAHSASVSSEADSLDASSEVGWVRRGLFTRMMRRRLQGGGGIEAGASAGGGWRTPPPGAAAPSSSALSSASPRTPASSPAPPPPRLARADSSALEEYQRHVRAADGDHAPSPRYGGLVGGAGAAVRLSSLREAVEGEGEEVVVVAPRCFCLMSDQPNHGSLMKLLQLIVDREREQADWGGGARRLMMGNKALSALKRRHSCNALASSPPTSSSPGFLLAAVARPVVTGAGGLSGAGACAGTGCGDLSVLRRRFLDHVQRELLNAGTGSSSVSISYPAYSPAPTRIDLPLVALEDWTCAVLFSRVSADVVVKIVNLLLLEQSLVIVGEDLGLVSAIATALISLLAPFRWDNPFVPALPAGLSELLQAPVPYIVGTAATPEFDPTRATPHAAVLHLGRCREHLRLPDVKLPLPHAYQLLQEVHDAARVFAGRRSRCWANLHLATYMSGLTPDETRALAGVKAVFRRYVENLCGDIKYPQAWRKYGFLNAESGHFIFEPAWFLAPLEVALQFQSALVRTQMLAHYIETRRAEDRKEEQRLARCRRFLRHWLAFRVRQWRKQKKKKKKKKKALQEEKEEEDEVDESGPGFMLM